MKTYKGVIFDLDGTLLNTIEDLTDSVNEAMKGLGYRAFSQKEIMQKVGNGFRVLLIQCIPEEERTQERIDQAVEIFVGEYAKRYQNKTKPYEGITKLLEQLEKRKIKMAVNSNKRNDYTNSLIQTCFPHISFTGVFGERAGVAKKPDPASALELAGLMGFCPEEILYVGDSSIDIQTGKNAGMDVAGVSWGFRGREDLEKNGASCVVDYPEEILRLFDYEPVDL